MNIRFFQVGGSVRDQFLGVKSKDIDFAVQAPSWEAMREAIIAKGGKIFLETPQYFTIRAKVPELGAADFVLCRKDGTYKDGRHPETVEVGSIFDDLARRDFTMNAMAFDVESGKLLDPHNGYKDLSDGIVRAVGDAGARFREDRLRVFRALRFAITKNMRLDHDINNEIGRLTPMMFDGVSTERIREELVKMFASDTFRSFRLLRDHQVLWDVALARGIWFKPTVEAR